MSTSRSGTSERTSTRPAPSSVVADETRGVVGCADETRGAAGGVLAHPAIHTNTANSHNVLIIALCPRIPSGRKVPLERRQHHQLGAAVHRGRLDAHRAHVRAIRLVFDVAGRQGRRLARAHAAM